MMSQRFTSFVFVVLFMLRIMRQRLRCLTNLPEELQAEIFLRLPTKSLLVIRCVCKSFNTITQKPSFIRAHLTRISSISTITPVSSLILNIGGHPHHPDYYASLYRQSQHFLLSIDKTTKDLLNYISIAPPIPIVEKHTRWFVVGSCNGLICFGVRFNVYKIGKLFFLLWNPVIRQCRYLPRPKYRTSGHLFQFGFVSETNEYIVLKIGTRLHQLRVEVYKMNIDAWTIIDCSSFPENLIRSIYADGNFVFFKGSFHWPARNSNIVYCNIKDVNLEVMKAVDDERVLREYLTRHEDRGCNICKVAVVDESLAMIYWNGKWTIGVCDMLEIWVMKEYGVEDSWTLRFKIGENVCRCLYPVGYWTDGNLLITEGTDRAFQLYDLNTGLAMEIQKMEANTLWDLTGFFDFVETLAPVRSVH